jgi:hypothetical protein
VSCELGSPISTSINSVVLVRVFLSMLFFYYSCTIGGVDLLLHLLSSVTGLPVTKSVVKASGMGKAIGSIEKHALVVGTPNETAVKDRVQSIKDSWHASVKALKGKDTPAATNTATKRQIESPVTSPVSAKRTKVVDDSKKVSTFSSLMKKVTSSAGNVGMKSVSTAGALGNGVMDSTLSSKDADDSGEKSNGSENKGE